MWRLPSERGGTDALGEAVPAGSGAARTATANPDSRGAEGAARGAPPEVIGGPRCLNQTLPHPPSAVPRLFRFRNSSAHLHGRYSVCVVKGMNDGKKQKSLPGSYCLRAERRPDPSCSAVFPFLFRGPRSHSQACCFQGARDMEGGSAES